MYRKKNPETDLCPFELTLSIFKGKWDVRVICILAHNHTVRYGQFKHYLPEISDTILASVLKKMGDNSIIERKDYDELPPRVEYSLSEAGKAVVPVLQDLCRWSYLQYGDKLYLKDCANCRYGIVQS